MQTFSSEQAGRLTSKTYAEINRQYAPGALAWARQHRPDLTGKMKAAEQDYDEAYLAENMADLIGALDRFKEIALAIVQAYGLASTHAGHTDPAAPAPPSREVARQSVSLHGSRGLAAL